jgi:hypothetical protein
MHKMTLGSSPWGVTPAQLGTVGYFERSHREMTAYIGQLGRLYADAHGGAKLPCKLVITTNPHDFDRRVMDYYEVYAVYGDGASERAAFWLESEMPEDWDHVAAAELDLAPGDDLVPPAEAHP